MAEYKKEKKISGVYGGINFGEKNASPIENGGLAEFNADSVQNSSNVFNGSNIQDNVQEFQANDEQNITKVNRIETYNGINETASGYEADNDGTIFKRVEAGNLPLKTSVWTKIRAFLFKEIDLNAPIKIELTPYQQKVENEINEFLHQEVSLKGIFNIFKSKK